MKIKFKKFFARAIEPSLATSGSDGFDLASAQEVIIPPRPCQCIKTDIGIAIPKGYFGKIHARSIWARRFTSVAGGVIDSDYRGNISIIFHNYSDNWLQVHQSEKFAQIARQKKAANEVFEEVKNFGDTTERGEGGFGSRFSSRRRGKRDIHVNCYIPQYVKPNLKWYERDGLMTYHDHVKYEEYARDPDRYLSRANIVNFDLTHAQCRFEKPSLSKKFYQTVSKSHVDAMPSQEKDKAVSACLRSERTDVFVEKKIIF